jgi:predicted nucleic acid-binding protein
MSQLCIDASVAAKLVFKGEPDRASARRLVRDCVARKTKLVAPAFFENEVDSAVSKRLCEARLTLMAARQAYAGLDRIPVYITTHPQLRQRARAIAEQFAQRTVYDSTYAALAELLGCDFWTADKKFYDAVKATLPFVKYLPSYPRLLPKHCVWAAISCHGLQCLGGEWGSSRRAITSGPIPFPAVLSAES